MVLVEVIKNPIRYEGKRYYKGEQFQVDAHHVNPAIMKLVGEVDSDQTGFSFGQPIVLSEEQLEKMSVDGLKDYAKEFDIKLGRASSKDGIIEKIVKAQSKEV
mgnify:CR=1 FL=1